MLQSDAWPCLGFAAVSSREPRAPLSDNVMQVGDFQITPAGICAAAAAWVVVMFFVASDSACLGTNSCGPDDFVLFAFIGLGMLVPAGIVALVVSEVIGL